MKTIVNSFTAIFSALLASTCCVGPLLSIVGLLGVSASTLTWLITIKPYLIGLSLALTSYNLYLAYFPKQSKECCSLPEGYEELKTEEKKVVSFLQSKAFLWAVTLVTLFTLLLPYIINA